MLQWKRPVLSTKDSGTGEPATSAAEHGLRTRADRVKSAGKGLSVRAPIITHIIMLPLQVKGSIDTGYTAERMQATAHTLSHRNAIHMGNRIMMYFQRSKTEPYLNEGDYSDNSFAVKPFD